MSEQDGIDQAAEFGAGSSSLPLGRELARLREERGWSQEFVSERLKFAVRQIRALEAENWGELPSGMPLRGFVRNYARLLETDPEPLLRSLAPGLQAHDPVSLNQASTLSDPIAPSPGRSSWPASGRRRVAPWLVGGVMAIAAVLLLGYALQQQGKLPFGEQTAGEGTLAAPVAAADPQAAGTAGPDAAAAAPAESAPAAAADGQQAGGQGVAGQDSAAQAPGSAPLAAGQAGAPAAGQAAVPAAPTAGAATADAAAAGTAPADTGSAVPAPGPQAAASAEGGIALAAHEECWVQVRRADGTVAISRTLAANENYQLEPAGAPYKVIIGNVKGVDLNWRGAPVDLGQYRRDNVARLTLQ